MPTTLVWLRHDLRLADHPALDAAARRGAVVPVFIWAPDEEEPAPGGAHRWWLDGSLRALGADLEAKGSRLVVRRGPSLGALREVMAETGADAVFWNARPEPALARRDASVARRLRVDGVEVQTFTSRLLHDPDAVRTGSGGSYRVFGPFQRRFLAEVEIAAPLAVPVLAGCAPATWPASEPIDALRLDALAQDGIDWAASMRPAWTRGEAGARARLSAFVDERLHAYSDARDRVGEEGSSSLEPHLHHGEVSPRGVWAAVRAGAEATGQPAVAEKYLSEIAWREFAYHVLHHHPRSPVTPLNPDFLRLPTVSDPDAFVAWRIGQTGYPVVDAGMRQLWALGWMHNRARMITASFLTKDLLLPWQDGARHFHDALCGADLASNTLNWQWAAGSGADAQPFFRIFNPVAQGEKFDPAGAYVRRWVPELADVPAKFIHRPWEAPASVLDAAGVTLGTTYPRPIVDHGVARTRALAAYKAMRPAREEAEAGAAA